MTVHLEYHEYKYFPYEVHLAKREAELLSGSKSTGQTDTGLLIDADSLSGLERLVYFRRATLDGTSIETYQSQLESACLRSGHKSRQSTRYSAHGLHEYKGKFNPQMVGAMSNLFGLGSGDVAIDPFGGSGTSLAEFNLRGIEAYSTDINPLAVRISNAKIRCQRHKASTLRQRLAIIIDGFQNHAPFSFKDDVAEYLKKWFIEPKFDEAARLRAVIDALGGPYKDIFLCLASDVLREHSNQDPADLRIRRRRCPVPEKSLLEDFSSKADQFIENLAASQRVTGLQRNSCRAFHHDSRNGFPDEIKRGAKKGARAFVTSPPYATALPYIDTQRLSLVWMGLVSPKKLNPLESELIGSREQSKRQAFQSHQQAVENCEQLPESVANLCQLLSHKLDDADGFRRRAVPGLMYRYFSGMRRVFNACSEIAAAKAKFGLVVGVNSTTLGGERIVIETPKLLGQVASQVGWHVEELLPLEAYQRYGLHAKNAVRQEALLVLAKGD